MARPVAPEQGVLGLCDDVHPVLTGSAYVITAHHVAYHYIKADCDPVPLGVTDRVAREYVVVAAVNLNACALRRAKRVFHLWKLRAGKIVGWAVFLDRFEALEAAGLRE